MVDLVRGPAWGTAAAWCEAVATVPRPDGAAWPGWPAAAAGVAAAASRGAATNMATMAATRIAAGRAADAGELPRIRAGGAPTAGADRGARSRCRTERVNQAQRATPGQRGRRTRPGLTVSGPVAPATWRAGRGRSWGTRRPDQRRTGDARGSDSSDQKHRRAEALVRMVADAGSCRLLGAPVRTPRAAGRWRCG